jgi:hypothetical protein
MAAGIAIFSSLLAMFITSALLRFGLWKEGPPTVRTASTLIFVGTILVVVYGIGVVVVGIGMLFLMAGRPEVEWLPSRAVALISFGFLAMVPLPFIRSNPGGLVPILISGFGILFGLGWIQFGLSVPTRGRDNGGSRPYGGA